ncbi:hypothetical protein CR513_37459, partial [Mucuna pruriens]
MEEEKTKHEKSVSVAWTMTLNNMQMDCLPVQGMVGFSSLCMVVFKSVYNKAKVTEQEHDVKRILQVQGLVQFSTRHHSPFPISLP